jgi:hypothetical protein
MAGGFRWAVRIFLCQPSVCYEFGRLKSWGKSSFILPGNIADALHLSGIALELDRCAVAIFKKEFVVR